jgi:5'-nucleotidase
MAPVRLPRVLVTNDDGIQAPGIRALISALMKEGLFDVGLFYAKANTCVCIACTPNDYQSQTQACKHACTGTSQVAVCAPNGERSAQSHAITLGQHLSCVPW